MKEHIGDYDWQKDSFGNFTIAVLALREIGVRNGTYRPLIETERRQAKEGPVRTIDCVKEATDAR